MYNKQLLDEVYCDMKITNVKVRVISRAEGKDDNSPADRGTKKQVYLGAILFL